MAILKTSKNRTVTVSKKYTVISSSLTKTATSVKVDATQNNLILNCIKKITASGEKTS